ncbi:MAG: type II toxin-antitoxin system VapC family toxin [Nocardioides sp.]
MIVADTNVWSEPLRRRPDPRVIGWFEEHLSELALTTVTVAELLYGALRLDPGRRRDGLLVAIEALVEEAEERVLPFDMPSARAYASLRASRQRRGRPGGMEDLMIGAICHAGRVPLATRNVRDFHGLDLDLINPWQC